MEGEKEQPKLSEILDVLKDVKPITLGCTVAVLAERLNGDPEHIKSILNDLVDRNCRITTGQISYAIQRGYCQHGEFRSANTEEASRSDASVLCYRVTRNPTEF